MATTTPTTGAPTRAPANPIVAAYIAARDGNEAIENSGAVNDDLEFRGQYT